MSRMNKKNRTTVNNHKKENKTKSRLYKNLRNNKNHHNLNKL